jgi:hypothetical protein
MIQEARYTSPSGKETAFEWETGKRETELKTGVYTFPGRDGAHVQHQGAGARSFPLVCIFSGVDCMEKADAFEAMLIERGIAELQHPTYGTVKVVPTGKIEREDDPVNKNGESSVKITFTETITDEEAAALDETVADAIDEGFDEFSEAAVSDFAENLDTENISEQLAIQTALEDQTQNIVDNLQPLAASNKKTFADWLASAKELKDSIKNLYNKGLAIAGKVEGVYVKALNIGRLTLRLMKLPARLSVSLAEKIKGYSTLTAVLINQYKNDPFDVAKMVKAYATARLALTGAAASIASGSALTIAEIAASTGAAPAPPARSEADATGGASGGDGGTSNGARSGGADRSAGTTTREDAVNTANSIGAFLKSVIDFQDERIAQNVFVDTDSASYGALQELVSASIQLILNASFALPLQKTIILDRDRQVIELCAELYGTTDCLDEFIIENNFNIDEIELLPMGKKVSYYVKSA